MGEATHALSAAPRGLAVAGPHHPGRRREQEDGEVPRPREGPYRGRPGAAAQQCRHRRRRPRRDRGCKHPGRRWVERRLRTSRWRGSEGCRPIPVGRGVSARPADNVSARRAGWSRRAGKATRLSIHASEQKAAPVGEVRALGLTDDGKSLVLVDLSRGAEGERFRVAADDRLRAALRSGAPRAAQVETRVESALSPREIQARLRAGATADEVAKAAGIPVNRIQRYEGPILAERDRVVSEARRASAPGPHRNTPGRPLGTLVDDRLEQEGVEPESATWDARRRNDGTWLVTLSSDPGGPARATWSWDPQARRVRAVDAGATAILAPMPAPTTGPDSLTALAEAAGVASAEVPNEAAERQAVGDDGRRRSGLPTRGGSGRASGLVVLAGRGEQNVDEVTGAGVPEAGVESGGEAAQF